MPPSAIGCRRRTLVGPWSPPPPGLWRVEEWEVEDSVLGGGGPRGADLWIQSVDEEDDVFALIEVKVDHEEWNSVDDKNYVLSY